MIQLSVSRYEVNLESTSISLRPSRMVTTLSDCHLTSLNSCISPTNKCSLFVHMLYMHVQIDRQIDRQLDRQLDSQIARQLDSQIDRQIDRQTDRQIDRYVYIYIYVYTVYCIHIYYTVYANATFPTDLTCFVFASKSSAQLSPSLPLPWQMASTSVCLTMGYLQFQRINIIQEGSQSMDTPKHCSFH